MITLHGTAVSKGIAIAEAAVLPACGGVADLPHSLLERGIAALKRRLPESETPEIVIICGSAAEGCGLRLPGVRVAAVAAESDDGGFTASSIPCVAGVQDLLRDANNGDIVIVDGIRGVIYLDPDADTLIHYQSIVDAHKTKRIFLESRHLPAITQEGKMISVYSVANCTLDILSSLDEGADGIVIPRQLVSDMTPADWGQCITLAAGKPLILLAAPDIDSVRTIVSESLPGQISVAFSCDEQENAARFQADVDAISAELMAEGAEPAAPIIAVSVRNPEACAESPAMAPRLLLDAGGCDATATHDELRRCVVMALAGQGGAGEIRIPTTIILGTSIDAVSHLPVEVDSLAAPVGLIGVTKDLIRSFPLDTQFPV